ncbi:THAP domain-containing protein 6-like isoform X1 [Festucalex cinctus]
MPDSCAAWGCTNRRTAQSKSQGITFHRFPKEKTLRRHWEAASRMKGFSATRSSVLCSEHFKPEDIDATGQTVRIREGARPSVFSFNSRFQKQVFTRRTQTSKKARESVASVASKDVPLIKSPPASVPPPDDHCYALPASLPDLKARLMAALARVESLEHELRNMKDRERRAKNTVFGLLEDLRDKNIINEELREKLDSYSGLPVHLLSKQSNDYTKDQRDFALTLHLHDPKAYNYLRKSLHLQLPHPHTLQRWMSSGDFKPGQDSISERRSKKEAEDECETAVNPETDILHNPLAQNIIVCLKDAPLSQNRTEVS